MRVPVTDRPSKSASSAKVEALFPLMDASSGVSPTIREEGTRLVLAYHLPDCEDSAVVSFDGVTRWCYGSPSDERLHIHPLWDFGLTFYNFHRLLPEETNCWVATFHDGTLEVVASTANVLATRLSNVAPVAALTSVIGPGENLVLG